MKGAGQQAIQSVTEAGRHKNHQRPKIVPLHKMDHDEGNKNHPQQGELVGRGEQLRKLQRRPPWLEEFGRPRLVLEIVCSAGASDAAACSPVLARNRCEREGSVPTGKSSSTRSMR